MNTIFEMAEELKKVYPEAVKTRFIPVSEIEVNRSNVPTMPLGIVALKDIDIVMPLGSNKSPEITENIIVEIWFKSQKLQRTDKTETQFWAAYDYDDVMQKFIDWCMDFKTSKNGRIRATKMEIDSSEVALMISFTVKHTYEFCRSQDDGVPVKINTSIRVKTECDNTQVC